MAEANELDDGYTTFVGGQDSSKSPDKISESSYAAGVNLSTENSNLKPRWRYCQLPLSYTDQLYTLPTLQKKRYEIIFRGGRFQARVPYKIGLESYVVIVINGIIFLTNLKTNLVQVLELPNGDRMDETSPRINWSSQEGTIVFCDFPGRPVIMEGLTVRRSDPTKDEIPVCTIAAYNQNRLFIANNGLSYTAGDPTGNLATPGAPLTFEEVIEPSTGFTGQAFNLPTGLDSSSITCLTFLPFNDTGTGVGPLIVANKSLIFWAQSQIPRQGWEPSNFASAYVNDAGIVGQRAAKPIGSDLYFMSDDETIRSANMSRTEQGQWSRQPISAEVKDWIKFSDKALKPYTVIESFKNKIFCTVNPYYVEATTADGFKTLDVAFAGMVTLELDNVATLSQRANPVWAGLWTGVDPMDFFESDKRFYVIAKYHNENTIWEIDPNALLDSSSAGLFRQVQSRLYSRTHSFKSSVQNKDFKGGDFAFTNIKGNFELKAQIKSTQAAEFSDWRSFKHNAPFQCCKFPNPIFLNGFQYHSFRQITLGSPKNLATACNPYSKELLNTFRELQVKLDITGADWELKNYRLKATVKAQTENQTPDQCKESDAIALPKKCSDDWNVEDFNLCLP